MWVGVLEGWVSHCALEVGEWDVGAKDDEFNDLCNLAKVIDDDLCKIAKVIESRFDDLCNLAKVIEFMLFLRFAP